MSSPDSRDITLVRCLKCMKIFPCYDTLALLQHIRNDHPEINIITADAKHKRSTSLRSSKADIERDDEIREYRNTDKNFLSDYKENSVHNEYEYNEHDWAPRPQYVRDVDLSQYSAIPELCRF